MSLCIRTISNKLTSIVGTRKAATRVDRQLPKHIEKTSTFLEEFLGVGTSAKSQSREPVITGSLVAKPLKKTTSDNIVAWNYKLRSDRIWNIGRSKQDCIDDVARNFSNCRIVCDSKSATVLSVAEKDGVVRSERTSGVQKRDLEDNNPLGKPSQEQLTHVYEVLREDLPLLFVRQLNYAIYDPEIVFENNIRGTVTRGMYEYVKQVAMLKIFGHLKFAFVKFEVLKITAHPEDNSVKVRWRIRGLQGTKVFFKFWKYKIWNVQHTVNQLESWHDGFSTFYVADNGKVTKHVADKMMPDQDNETAGKDITAGKTGIAKLALFVGLLTPREFFDIAPLMSVGVEDRDSANSVDIDTEDRDSVNSVDSSVEQNQ